MKLDDWIKLKGSQADFGREIGWTRDKVSKIASGSQHPTLEDSIAIGNLTKGKVKPQDLIDTVKAYAARERMN